MQLQIEEQALKKESDPTSKEKLEKLHRQIEKLSEERDELKAHWEKEKSAIARIRQIKSEIEETKIRAQQAEREGNLEKAAELKYGRLVELQKELEAEQKRLAEIQRERKMLKEEVDEEDIARIVSKWTGIPVQSMLESEREKLLKMEERIKQRVVGQDEAVKAVADAIRRGRAGLDEPNRPIGSFIFVGPTGVGKTELAKALAEFLFDNENALVRIDMSEYMEKHTVSRLIGAPPGYVGYEEGGYLTEAIRRRPYAVILLDEIEKAHPDVFNILLQILDDGRLTDSKGHTVDFTNTVIIMTSNIGTQFISQTPQFDMDQMRAKIMEAMRSFFRPEFLNRIDEIIVFRSLTKEDIEKIVDIQIEYLRKRLQAQKLDIVLMEEARAFLADVGYDPVYGARPLKRTIQRLLQNELAKKILAGEFKEGDTIKVDKARDGGLVFTTLEKETARA